MKKIAKNISISLVIPTYNDELTVIDQVSFAEKILKKYYNDYEIIIADDGSIDKTRALLQKHYKKRQEFRLIFNKKNVGIFSNVHQLYTLATKEFLFFYSADGDWDPRDIEHLIQTQLKEKADIVIGKRIKKIGYTPYRKLVSFFHRVIPIILFGVDTYDPGGIKLIKTKLAHIPLVSQSQFFEAEIIIRAKLKGYKISWYPIIYKKRYYGKGLGGKMSSAWYALRDLIKLRFSL